MKTPPHVTPGQMWWAKRPVRSDSYEVRVDSASYDPNGKYIPVHVRVTKYGWKSIVTTRG